LEDPNVTAITGAFAGRKLRQLRESPEAVKLWGDLSDWHHAIGTGAYMVKDLFPTVRHVYQKPELLGYDERYPKNQLPYVDQVNVLIIYFRGVHQNIKRAGIVHNLGNIMKQAKKMQEKMGQLQQELRRKPSRRRLVEEWCVL